jgi:DNA-binding CsgD family transcriptional regulator
MTTHDLKSELTESQRICLRLVGTGMSSKEIALQTGFSPGTVDQYVSRAAATLGASTRREAARMLAELDAAEFNKVELKPQPVAEPENPVSIVPIDQPSFGRSKALSLLQWVPALGGERYDLTASQKILEIIKAAFIAAIGFGSIVATGAWLQALFTSHH